MEAPSAPHELNPDLLAFEMAEVKAVAITNGNLVYDDEGAFHFALNPSGEHSRLAEQHWLMVRTPSFKKWFGDWEVDPENSSKVVDSSGEPLLLWHESPLEKDFDVFDDDKIGSTNDSGYYGRGHYFFTQRNEHATGFYGGVDAVEYACFANVRSLLREDTPELEGILRIMYGNPDRDTAIKECFAEITQYRLGYSQEDVARMYDEIEATDGRFMGYEGHRNKGALEDGLHELIVRSADNVFVVDKHYADGSVKHCLELDQDHEIEPKEYEIKDLEAELGFKIPDFSIKDLENELGFAIPDFKEASSIETIAEAEFPSVDHLFPEANTAKSYVSTDGLFDLRISSTNDHQDGLAYNSRLETVVVCDGLGGIGPRGDVKDHFGFALAHATAELEDITTLRNPSVVASVVERAKSILEDELFIPIEETGSKIKTTLGGGFKWASTIAAVQRVPDTNRWRVVTIGDSSVVLLDSDGTIKQGFGEAFQLIAAGEVGDDGTADDAPMSSLVGIKKGSLEGGVKYGNDTLGAQFIEIELKNGQKLAAASDAYIQKSPPPILERDARMSAQQWTDAKPLYGDDTTLAIVG